MGMAGKFNALNTAIASAAAQIGRILQARQNANATIAKLLTAGSTPQGAGAKGVQVQPVANPGLNQAQAQARPIEVQPALVTMLPDAPQDSAEFGPLVGGGDFGKDPNAPTETPNGSLVGGGDFGDSSELSDPITELADGSIVGGGDFGSTAPTNQMSNEDIKKAMQSLGDDLKKWGIESPPGEPGNKSDSLLDSLPKGQRDGSTELGALILGLANPQPYNPAADPNLSQSQTNPNIYTQHLSDEIY